MRYFIMSMLIMDTNLYEYLNELDKIEKDNSILKKNKFLENESLRSDNIKMDDYKKNILKYLENKNEDKNRNIFIRKIKYFDSI
jgi:hypothetical protein